MADEVVDPVSDNQALNQMVVELEEISDRLGNRYDKINGDANPVLLTSASPRIRAAMPLAIKTVVTNTGPNSAEVRENGVLVATVLANTTKELPLSGAGPLKFSVASGQTANLAVATYSKAAS